MNNMHTYTFKNEPHHATLAQSVNSTLLQENYGTSL